MFVDKNKVVFLLMITLVFFSGLLTRYYFKYSYDFIILCCELVIIFLCILMLKNNSSMINLMKRYWLITFLSSILFAIVLFIFLPLRTNEQVFYILFFTFAVLIKDIEPYLTKLKRNKLLVVLFLLWVSSISYSFFTSPLEVSHIYTARLRFEQTIVHFVCSFCLLIYFQDNRPPVRYLFYAIIAASVFIGCKFLYLYLTSSEPIGSRSWKVSPPFRGHIRHVGYQVTAGLSVMLAFLITSGKLQSKLLITFHFMMITFLWALLFWLGGRASISATIVLAALLAVIFRNDAVRLKYFLVLGVGGLIAGILLSEWMSVFPWNGLIHNVAKTVTAETVFDLTSGRNSLWELALIGLKENWLFGLGADAYIYIAGVKENYSVKMPHGVIVQFLVEWGIVGCMLIVSILFLALFNHKGLLAYLKDGRLSINSTLAVSIIITYSINSLSDGHYFHAQPIFYLVIAFAVWGYEMGQISNKASESICNGKYYQKK